MLRKYASVKMLSAAASGEEVVLAITETRKQGALAPGIVSKRQLASSIVNGKMFMLEVTGDGFIAQENKLFLDGKFLQERSPDPLDTEEEPNNVCCGCE